MADINKIAKHMEGKIISDVQVVYGEDTLVIYLSDEDGQITSVELIVDSIYLNYDEEY
jgi:hypothetical protein